MYTRRLNRQLYLRFRLFVAWGVSGFVVSCCGSSSKLSKESFDVGLSESSDGRLSVDTGLDSVDATGSVVAESASVALVNAEGGSGKELVESFGKSGVRPGSGFFEEVGGNEFSESDGNVEITSKSDSVDAVVSVVDLGNGVADEPVVVDAVGFSGVLPLDCMRMVSLSCWLA